MAQGLFFPTFLMLWLAGRASADGGDDFANNLASDLGPILALFGERVVMQFMSQAMGIADCILLAVAPIGAITTVVSAIRVAGPAWLKSFIGRARENLSAAEIEVMSSTSKEACELWNGQSVIRCPGSADIYQFICLIPNGYNAENLSQKQLDIQYKKLEVIERDIDKDVEEKGIEKDTERVIETVSGVTADTALLQKINATGPAYAWECLETAIRSFLYKVKGTCRKLPRLPRKNPDLESQHESSRSTLAETFEPPSSNMSSPSRANTSRDLGKGGKVEITIVVDGSDDNTPNLLLNCHDGVGRGEIYLAAVFGVILQLGAIVYFGLITYRQPIRRRLLKDGKRAVDYAFPCAAAGTVLLVFGLFICAWVVGESTKETYYKAKDHQIFIVWLQKNHTVSDQVFKPYAIYPTKRRDYIALSRRNIKHRPHEVWNLIQQVWKKITNSQITNDQEFRGQNRGDPSVEAGETKDRGNKSTGGRIVKNEQTWYWPLKFITFLGALISLIGFISQFIGMRGLNWTASVVQLGITVLVTILRVIVRRGLGKPPFRQPLKSKSELDWFALSFGDLSRAPWVVLKANTGNEANGNDDLEDEYSSQWIIRTGGEKNYPPLEKIDENSSQSKRNSTAQNILVTRQELGKLSEWKSPVFEEAKRLSGAIETVAYTLLEKSRENKFVWTIPATYRKQKTGSDIEIVEDDIYIELFKEDSKWKVDNKKIEAILSLWLYSTPSEKHSEAHRRCSLRLYGPEQAKTRLDRDLEWWMPETSPEMSAYTEAEIAKLAEEKFEWTVVGFTSEALKDVEESDKIYKGNEPNKKYLGLECQDMRERLFSRDLLFSFIRAVAKMPEVAITSASSVYQMNYNKMRKGWKGMRLKNNTVSDLARKLEKIGFGTLSDIYLDLIVPLSLERKLTNVKNIIEEATKQAQEHEKSRQWKKLVDICNHLLALALQFDLRKESSGPLAIAVCLGFLYRLRHEALLQEFEGREEEELTSQLAKLEKEFKNERFTGSNYFSPIPADNWKHYAMSFNRLIGSAPESLRTFPDSFQVTYDHQEVIGNNALVLSGRDFKVLEKTDAFGWSPLHYAANLPIGKILILPSLKIEVLDLRDFMGWTPLQHACLNGNGKVVGMLLDQGASIEIAGKDGITPIHCAVQSGNADILQELIENINSRRQKHTRKRTAHVDCNERHPIHWAAVQGHVNIVRLLKDDIGLKDRFGWTCLHLAVIYKHEDLLKYIIEDCAAYINIGDNDFRTPLHIAAEYKSQAAVHMLIKAGAEVDPKAKDGSTPLHMAVRQKDIVEMLLDKGAKKEATDIEGRTPLYLAVADGITEVTNLLIDKGANVATAGKDGRTPLHMALSHGTDGLDIAKKLLQVGKANNADNSYAKTAANDCATPLHIAAEYGLTEAIDMLIEAGFNINATDEYGQTPLLIAIYEKKWTFAEKLLKFGADVKADKRYGYTPLLGAIIGGEGDVVQKLLKAGVDVDVTDKDGYSPLHLAIDQGNLDILERLLEADANIDAVDGLRNQTPLHIAVRQGNKPFVHILLEKGAKTRLLNFLDFSPLQDALSRGNLEIVKVLVEHDKSLIIQKGKGGDTPLHTLCYWTHLKSDEETMCRILDELLIAIPNLNLNVTNDSGRTPLDFAVSEAGGYRKFIDMLEERGAKQSYEETDEEEI
ncbi:ankyrin repeat-containing domain protein [Trichoderma ceciliae]